MRIRGESMIVLIQFYTLLAVIMCMSTVFWCFCNYEIIMYYTPNCLYRKTKMNIVGCYIVSFLYLLINPIYMIGLTVGIWIYKILCIGRNK